jgi:hypothetical protein
MPTIFLAESKNTASTEGSGSISHTTIRSIFFGSFTTLPLSSVTDVAAAFDEVVFDADLPPEHPASEATTAAASIAQTIFLKLFILISSSIVSAYLLKQLNM